jgi:ribonucleoside-diphosphate reductase alpha chain
VVIEDTNEKENGPPVGKRRRLPDERSGLTHHFSINTTDGELDGYLTVGHYDDGSPGEIFIRISKTGSLVQGLLDNLALAVSVALQHGVPLDLFVEKYTHQMFEPSGMTTNPEIPIAKSLSDYVFQWLGQKYCGLSPRVDRGEMQCCIDSNELL